MIVNTKFDISEAIYELAYKGELFSSNLFKNQLYFSYLEDAKKYAEDEFDVISSTEERFSKNVVKKLKELTTDAEKSHYIKSLKEKFELKKLEGK